MSVERRASGITVEANGAAIVGDGNVVVTALDEGALPPPMSGASSRRRGARRAGTVAARETFSAEAEAAAIQKALGEQDFELVDAIPLRTEPRSVAPASQRRGARRAGTSSAALVSVVDVGVPLEAGERAVVLLEQDGEYKWHIDGAADESDADEVMPPATVRKPSRAKAAGRRAAKKAPAKSAKAATSKRVAHFHLELAPPREIRRTADGRRRSIIGAIAGKAVAYVLRFAAKPILNKASQFLERNIAEGVVHITGADSTKWTTLDAKSSVPIPKTGTPKVLLFVHGTFSSTLGSFGALSTFDEGKQFLQQALENYDLVLGWNHRTLSVAPDKNAADFHDWLQAQKWPSPPVIDAIAYSRGGLVFRSLVEDLLPNDKKNRVTIGQAIFVGCTNGGTQLANPDNWHRLADVYVNLAAAGARALTVVPGMNVAGMILGEAIGGLGGLLKVLATSATTDNAIPGLAAMSPIGPFIKRINSKQAGQPMPKDVRYYAITSNFDPDEAEAEARTNEMPAGLALKLADKVVDAMQRRNNDLVVNVDAMTQIDPDLGTYVRERLDYGTNGHVHHCCYFAQEETVSSLSQWLLAKS